MGTLRETLKEIIEQDASLLLLLTGGVFDAADFDQEGMSMKNVPKETNGVIIKPFAVLRWRVSTEYGPYKVGAENEQVEIYCYQNKGYDVIEEVVGILKTLLHDQYLDCDDRTLAHISQIFISGEMPAIEIQNAPCKFARYQIIHTRS